MRDKSQRKKLLVFLCHCTDVTSGRMETDELSQLLGFFDSSLEVCFPSHTYCLILPREHKMDYRNLNYIDYVSGSSRYNIIDSSRVYCGISPEIALDTSL